MDDCRTDEKKERCKIEYDENGVGHVVKRKQNDKSGFFGFLSAVPGKGRKEHMKYSDFQLSKRWKKYVSGCGRLGASLAAEIYGQGNDVCIADRDRMPSASWIRSYGGLTETGDAADLETLSRASAEKADCLFW